MAVHGERFGGRAIPREDMRASARADAQPRTKRVVVEKATERIGERVLFAAGDEDSSLADDLRDRSAGIADNGRTRGERFKSGQAEPLEERRVKQAFRSRVERSERRLVHEPGEDHAVTRRPLALESLTQVGRKLPELADDDEPEVTVAIRRGAEGTQESAHVLARIELPHVEDVARGHAESGTGERPTLIGWRWIELAVDRFRNDRHALRGDPEPFNDVPLRRFGDRDDRVGAPRERVLPGVPD